MTIASEITRLQTAKADMKTAIVNKGVSVADSVSLSDYCDCINAIQAGGCYPYVIDAVIIGGGGGGGGANNIRAGGGGGGGGVMCLRHYALRCNSYCVVIGQGGNGGSACCDGCDGGRSCFGTMFARGGGGGGKGETAGHDGGSGGGGGMFSSSLNYIAGGSTYCNVETIPRAGHDGGSAVYYRCCLSCYGGGGGGACCMGGTSSTNAPQKCGVGGTGLWISGAGWAKVFPTMYVAAGGGGGGQCATSSAPSSCPGGNGGTCVTKTGGNAITYGSGGGGAWSGCGSNNTCPGGNGCSGAVAIKYPKDGSYGFTCATGGTVSETSTCVYHLFTSDGTFCIVS